MPANPSRIPAATGNLAFDESVLDQIACPACFGALRREEEQLVCKGCGRRYPIINGIPVLIADRAVGGATQAP